MTTAIATRTVNIEFLYLDLDSCQRCSGTNESLAEAISAVRPALSGAGFDMAVSSTLVENEQEAADLGFVSSPTIRVNGIDIAGELSESICGDCGDLCGTDTMCREWNYRGEEYTVAPTGFIIEAIMTSAFRGRTSESATTADAAPDNLARFFESKNEAATKESSDRDECGCGPECC